MPNILINIKKIDIRICDHSFIRHETKDHVDEETRNKRNPYGERNVLLATINAPVMPEISPIYFSFLILSRLLELHLHRQFLVSKTVDCHVIKATLAMTNDSDLRVGSPRSASSSLAARATSEIDDRECRSNSKRDCISDAISAIVLSETNI